MNIPGGSEENFRKFDNRIICCWVVDEVGGKIYWLKNYLILKLVKEFKISISVINNEKNWMNRNLEFTKFFDPYKRIKNIFSYIEYL